MDARRPRTVRAVYWALLRQGFDAPAALKLTAVEFHIKPCRSGWTEAELQFLLWARWRVAHGMTIT